MVARTLQAHVRNPRQLELAEDLQLPVGSEVTVTVEQRAADAMPAKRLSIEDLLAARLTPPPGVGAVTLADVERAIAEGASGRAGA